MDVLAKLEEKIEALLARSKALEAENGRLRQNSEEVFTRLEAENTSLKEELARERESRAAVLARIDGLVSKLQAEGAPGE
jgi:predicted  nucleic acid-binding Zn-ribbon protein